MRTISEKKMEKIVKSVCKKHNVKVWKEWLNETDFEFNIDFNGVSDEVMEAIKLELAVRLGM